jgi:hypothetical protein
MSKHGIVAYCLAALVVGMFMGNFFINRYHVQICQLLTNHPTAKGTTCVNHD